MKYEFADNNGLRRRVLLPDDDTHGGPEAGIPLSLDVDTLYPDAPADFKRRLIEELWAVGLVEPCDFLGTNAVAKISNALLAALKQDAMNIISLAHQRCVK